VDQVWIDHDGGHFSIGIDDEGDALFLALFFEEQGAVVCDFVEAGEFEFELEFAPEGEHVDGERCDAIEVSAEDAPAVLGDGEIVFVESDFDDIGAASESLKDVFDRVREGRDGFADGGHAFGVDSFEVLVSVCEREPGVLTDGVEQGELFADEGVVLGGRVDVDRAEEVIAENDWSAECAADLVFLYRVAGGESWIGHGIGGEDAFADHRGVEDGA